MKILFTTILLLVTLNAQAYELAEGKYILEHKAVRSFFESNNDVLRSLTPDQEMVGWVVMCNGLYRVTKPYVGTTKNLIDIEEYFDGCYKIALMHSHPLVEPGKTTDFFSEEDLKFSLMYPLYMMAQENCFLRYADTSTEGIYGRYIDWLNCPARKN